MNPVFVKPCASRNLLFLRVQEVGFESLVLKKLDISLRKRSVLLDDVFGHLALGAFRNLLFYTFFPGNQIDDPVSHAGILWVFLPSKIPWVTISGCYRCLKDRNCWEGHDPHIPMIEIAA